MALPILAALLATTIHLPGGPPVGMDYLAYDRATNRVWVPAGNTGNVDVIDVATGKVTPLAGFPTAPPRKPGRPKMGPSSATVADGVVWIGNRGNNQLLAFDALTLAPKGTVQLDVMPDGLAYVARTHELWATTPGDQTIKVVDVGGKIAGPVASIKLDGAPEGYAVDDARGLFYTNLEDKDRTLTIDIKTRKVVASWPSGCGAEGPRGLALGGDSHGGGNGTPRLLFVACTDGAGAFDLAHDGKLVSRLKTGGGVDNLEYDALKRRLFVASGKDGTLTIAHVTDSGMLEALATVPTAKGARNPIADARGTVYVEDSAGGQLLVVDPDVAVNVLVTVKEEQPGLLAKAKITPAAATASAKARFPRANLVAAEIEQEHGKLIYSFDFKTEGKSGSDEVAVDALTGKVLAVEHESPKDEAKEKATDAKVGAKVGAKKAGKQAGKNSK
jgi:Peptidase propeptide and YPEB domain